MGVTQSRTGCLLSPAVELLEGVLCLLAGSSDARNGPYPGAGSYPRGRAVNHRDGLNSSFVGQHTLGEIPGRGPPCSSPAFGSTDVAFDNQGCG